MVYECHGLDTEQTVFFYEQDFYMLSNFSSFTVVWRGIRFDTLEHAYHWEKFHYAIDKEDETKTTFGGILPGEKIAGLRIYQEMIRTAPSAHAAFQLGQRYKLARNPLWDIEDESGEPLKVRVMLDLMRAKTKQHDYVRRKLLATGDRILSENSWRDSYWGIGADGKGLDKCGKCWMIVRTEERTFKC